MDCAYLAHPLLCPGRMRILGAAGSVDWSKGLRDERLASKVLIAEPDVPVATFTLRFRLRRVKRSSRGVAPHCCDVEILPGAG
jgi:hypothetical protein